MKVRKMVATICAAVMAMGTLAIEASASGSINITNYGNDVKCSISNLNQAGNTSTTKFKANYSGTHTFTMTVGSSVSTHVELVDSNGDVYVQFNIPSYAPGMPSTVTSNYSISKYIKYRVKANTNSTGTYSGSVIIDDSYVTT